jgi:hypothetical protein
MTDEEIDKIGSSVVIELQRIVIGRYRSMRKGPVIRSVREDVMGSKLLKGQHEAMVSRAEKYLTLGELRGIEEARVREQERMEREKREKEERELRERMEKEEGEKRKREEEEERQRVAHLEAERKKQEEEELRAQRAPQQGFSAFARTPVPSNVFFGSQQPIAAVPSQSAFGSPSVPVPAPSAFASNVAPPRSPFGAFASSPSPFGSFSSTSPTPAFSSGFGASSAPASGSIVGSTSSFGR